MFIFFDNKKKGRVMIPAAMVDTLSKRLIKVNAEKLYFRGIMCVCVWEREVPLLEIHSHGSP